MLRTRIDIDINHFSGDINILLTISSPRQPGKMGQGPFQEAETIRKDALMHANARDLDISATMRRAELETAHDDLDSVIAALTAVPSCDDQLLTRLKKRKLHLKDEIAALAAA